MPKKTVAGIIDSKNDYVIAVKQNQPQLYQQIKTTIEEEAPIDMDYTLEKNRGRQEERSVTIYEAEAIDKEDWKGVCQIIQVNRRVLHNDGRESYQEAFYIDSTGKSAAILNRGIRAHWSIENSLHWVKDVVLKEDDSKIHKGHAPENISTIKNWVMTIFRKNKYTSVTRAIRLVANDLGKIAAMLE